jgi:hypothetical protein
MEKKIKPSKEIYIENLFISKIYIIFSLYLTPDHNKNDFFL